MTQPDGAVEATLKHVSDHHTGPAMDINWADVTVPPASLKESFVVLGKTMSEITQTLYAPFQRLGEAMATVNPLPLKDDVLTPEQIAKAFDVPVEMMNASTVPPNQDSFSDEEQSIAVSTVLANGVTLEFENVSPETMSTLIGKPVNGLQHTGPDGALWEFRILGGWRIISGPSNPDLHATYGWWCTACSEHWEVHQGDPVACDSGGWLRPATSAEHKRAILGL